MKACKLWLAVGLAVALSGCDLSPQEVAASRALDESINQESLLAPVQVGVLPNGLPVFRSKLQVSPEYKGGSTRYHYVYIVDGTKSQTVNWEQTEGKTTVPYAQATIQLPPSATASEIIRMADDLKQQQDKADKAQWEQLNKKYGRTQ